MMNWSSIVNFLWQDNDLFQLAFFFLISGSVIFTIISLVLFSNEKAWQKKWDEYESVHNQFGVEHGSSHDVSFAIATHPERLAEILPSILLIVGLLGTFIGLGITLQAAGAAASDSKSLEEMIRGLGFKFRSSTWGIIAYLVIRAFYSAGGFERRRLYWCIGRMNAQIEIEKIQLAKNIERNKIFQSFLEGILKQQLSVTAELLKTTCDSNFLMRDFIQGSSKNILDMAKAADKMSGSAEKASDSSDKFISAINVFQNKVEHVLGNVRNDLNAAIQSMSKTFATNMSAMTESLKKSTDSISETVNRLDVVMKALTASVENTMNQVSSSVNKSVELQNRSALEFATTSHTLQEHIEAMTNLVRKLGEDIKVGLRAVSDTGEQIKSLSNKLKSENEGLLKHVDDVFSQVGNGNKEAAISAALLNDQVVMLNGLVEKFGQEVVTGFRTTSELGLQIKALTGQLKIATASGSNDLIKKIDQLDTVLEQKFSIIDEILRTTNETLTVSNLKNDEIISGLTQLNESIKDGFSKRKNFLK